MAPLDHRGRSYEVNVLGGVMLTAFGLGIAFPTVSIAVTAGIPARQQGVAGGLFVTAQQVGAAAGLAVLATIADGRTRAAHGSLVAGYRLSFLVAVGLIAVAAAIVLIQLRRTTATPRPTVPAAPRGRQPPPPQYHHTPSPSVPSRPNQLISVRSSDAAWAATYILPGITHQRNACPQQSTPPGPHERERCQW
jgi:MFS family permease